MIAAPVRRFLRLWPFILTFISTVAIIAWKTGQKQGVIDNGANGNDWIRVRLQKHQQEYIDNRGVHVIVGHYVGDDKTNSNFSDLTKEIINENNFNPNEREGQNGRPVVIPSKHIQKMQQLYQINRFNLMASDRIPLNRSLPDVRKKQCLIKYKNVTNLPTTSVIIVFHNEAWSTLLRTVWSVINRSPRGLLQEILLIDDASDRDFLRQPLDDYTSELPVSTRVIRSPTRVGLVKARLMGAERAQGEVLTFLDAHCECTDGWLVALLERISQNRKRVVCPVIDIISDDTFAYVKSFELHWGAFNWQMHFRWFTLRGTELEKRKTDVAEPFFTPAMAGGLFAIDKQYFYDIGSYDEGLKIWGGENLEMSFRVWQCGGSIEIVPCSHVGHLFRKSSPYSFPGGVTEVLYGNLARVALVWMDEWKDFYFKFTPEADRLKLTEDVESRLQLRKKLKCKSFKWYLNNVWSQHFFPMDNRFFGRIKNGETGECLQRPSGKNGKSVNQPMGLATLGPCSSVDNLVEMFVMTRDGFIMSDDSVCLDAPDKDAGMVYKVNMIACSGYGRQKWIYNKKTNEIKQAGSKLCLDTTKKDSDGLVLKKCNKKHSQKWILETVAWK